MSNIGKLTVSDLERMEALLGEQKALVSNALRKLRSPAVMPWWRRALLWSLVLLPLLAAWTVVMAFQGTGLVGEAVLLCVGVAVREVSLRIGTLPASLSALSAVVYLVAITSPKSDLWAFPGVIVWVLLLCALVLCATANLHPARRKL